MKRSNGEGSLFYSEAQQTWVGEVVLPDGRKKRKRNKLQRVVREWLEQQKEAIRKGTWVSNESVCYGDYIDRYISEVAEHSLRPKTLENYRYTIKNHIKPLLGEMRLVSIRPDHLQHLYSELLKKGLSKSSVRYIHAIIRKSLETATTWGLVARNVAQVVRPPTPETYEIVPLTLEEAKRFLNNLKDDRLYAFYVLLCTTAIRKGEALALQKTNLDLENGTMYVKNSLSQIYGQGLVLGEPKSKKSKRQLALPPFTIGVLKRHLVNHPNTSGYVFATSNNTPFSPRNILRHFKSKLEESGLPQSTRIHDLRHSVITWLLSSGKISLKEAQELAGHAQPSTTLNIYGHVLPGFNRKVASSIEDMIATE